MGNDGFMSPVNARLSTGNGNGKYYAQMQTNGDLCVNSGIGADGNILCIGKSGVLSGSVSGQSGDLILHSSSGRVILKPDQTDNNASVIFSPVENGLAGNFCYLPGENPGNTMFGPASTNPHCL